MHTRSLIFILTLILIFISIQTVQAVKIDVSLVLNNTDATVYIPGTGEVASASLGAGTNYTNLNSYLASYSGNAVSALVVSAANKMFVRTLGSTHELMLEPDIAPTKKVLLVFTDGGWQEIDRRMDLIRSGEFFLQTTPAFGFNLGTLQPIKMILSYVTFDIKGDMILNKGNHRLSVTYNGTSGGRPVVVFDKF